MNCSDACPSYPGKRYVDLNLLDLAGLPFEHVRPIRDAINQDGTTLLIECSPTRGADLTPLLEPDRTVVPARVELTPLPVSCREVSACHQLRWTPPRLPSRSARPPRNA